MKSDNIAMFKKIVIITTVLFIQKDIHSSFEKGSPFSNVRRVLREMGHDVPKDNKVLSEKSINFGIQSCLEPIREQSRKTSVYEEKELNNNRSIEGSSTSSRSNNSSSCFSSEMSEVENENFNNKDDAEKVLAIAYRENSDNHASSNLLKNRMFQDFIRNPFVHKKDTNDKSLRKKLTKENLELLGLEFLEKEENIY